MPVRQALAPRQLGLLSINRAIKPPLLRPAALWALARPLPAAKPASIALQRAFAAHPQPPRDSEKSPPQPPPQPPADPSEGGGPAKKPEPPKLSKDELLKRAKTVFGRLNIRFRWLMIRAYRPFNTDDFSAMFSWIIWGHILWIVLGTTTFLSLLVWALSKINAQEYLATWVGNLVTKETGLRVVFEEAIVPDWKQGSIVLNKVFVSRRPGALSDKVRVGSQQVAAAAAAVQQNAHQHLEAAPEATVEQDEDSNYTQFDVTIDSVAVTLSVGRWLAGKGLLNTVELKGVRGIVDRRYVRWDPNDDPRLHRNQSRRGDFQFTGFKMEDLLVTVLQPGDAQSYQLGIYACDLPQLRKQWLFYDFLNANNMSGSFDNSLFTLHPRQLANHLAQDTGTYQRIQRLRVDDVDVRHLNRGVDGMFGWIESGSVDFIADIMLPSDAPNITFKDKVQDVLERWEAIFTRREPADVVTKIDRKLERQLDQKRVLIDLRVQFNNTRARAPLYSADLNYLNNALIHPIIGYINSRDTYIPIHCRVVKKLTDFDGSWTFFDSGLMEDTSGELYEAFALNVADDEARSRRIRKVGFWSLQFLAQLVLLTLGIVA